jgi:hypothetical protein
MTERDFCYWLQGFMESREIGEAMTPRDCRVVQDHLDLVMTKKTPDRFVIVDKDESLSLTTEMTC